MSRMRSVPQRMVSPSTATKLEHERIVAAKSVATISDSARVRRCYYQRGSTCQVVNFCDIHHHVLMQLNLLPIAQQQ